MQVLRNADGGGGCQIFQKKRYECVRFNVIGVTRGWVGVQFPEKKRYVTLEWPVTSDDLDTPRALVYILLFVAVLFIYGRTFYTCS